MSSNVYVYKLDDTAISWAIRITAQSKIKSVDVNSSIYIDFGIGKNKKRS